MKSSNDIDKDGNYYVQMQRWYKKWWIWLIVIILCLIGKAFYSLNNSTSSNSSANSSNTARQIGEYHYDDQYFPISEVKNYKPNYKYNKWRGGNIKITRVKIYKTPKTEKYDSEIDTGTLKINGFATIYMVVDAKANIDIDFDSGDLIYSTLEKDDIDVYDGFDNSIHKNEKRTGIIKVPIKHLKKASDIKAFRLECSGEAANDDDDSLDKDFGFIVKLRS